ncbi:MAG: hypothetical protein IPO09_11390 [Anaeromyxobacter sp.]|nr:hypothetical protein [Anaeromyxobacter sp.]MBL0276859.1 hypothetical protein [Anaeromyxobacter sp.]
MSRSTLRILVAAVPLALVGCPGGGGGGEGNRAPTFTSTPATAATEDQPWSYQVVTADPDAGDVRALRATALPAWLALVDHGDGTATLSGAPRNEDVGAAAVALVVEDRAGASATQAFGVTVANVNDAPTIAGAPATTVEEGSPWSFTPAAADVDVGDVLTFSAAGAPAWILLDAGSGVLAGLPGPGDVGAAGPITLTVTDLAGASAALPPFTLVVTALPPVVPPDPATVAPPLDPTVTTSFGAAVSFLYSGSSPIQSGVAAGTIGERRAAVLRGRVLDEAGAPLPGVRLTVLGHPELGRTHSRADGRFDLAVNGGGELTVDYALTGFLPAQRKVRAPWRDFAHLPDVALVPLDPAATAVDLSSPAPFQVARGSLVTDADGARRATVLFPAGTGAELVLPGGATQPLTTLTVRATEYTVGPSGKQRMPAELPPTTAYTYAVELSVDEALAAGATRVTFTRPVPLYLEDFLGFPVGSGVPTGAYDRALGQWVPQPNGRVVQVLAVTGGVAALDTDGDGAADDGSALGVTAAERAQLGALYAAGQRLWRVPLAHFSPIDCNFPSTFDPPDVPPPDLPPPLPPRPRPADQDCCRPGSVLECANQVLGEAIPLAGTPFSLHYGTDRTEGWRTGEFDLQVTGASIHPALLAVDVQVSILGQVLYQEFRPAAPNQVFRVSTRGLVDPYGRPALGTVPVTVYVTYRYPVKYWAVGGQYYRTFGDAPPGSVPTLVTVRGLEEGGRVAMWSGTLEALRGLPGAALGGWSLSPHHAYQPATKVLHLGDGSRQGATPHRVLPLIEQVPGQTSPLLPAFRLLGSPSLRGGVRPEGLALLPDGSLLVADTNWHVVRRLGPPVEAPPPPPPPPDGAAGPPTATTARAATGSWSVFAGTPGTAGYAGDGGQATLARLSAPAALAVGPDGSVYVAERGNRVVRRVAPDGTITTVAGTGQAGDSGDGGPATAAALTDPAALAASADGALYLADRGAHRVRRVAPGGTISTVAGTGQAGFSGDGGLAALAQLSQPTGLAVDRAGNLLVADLGNARVRRLDFAGRIETVAGTGQPGATGDGGPALAARLTPYKLALEPQGALLVSDAEHRVRRIGPDGTITALAGAQSTCIDLVSGTCFGCAGGDGNSAAGSILCGPTDLAATPDGDLYLLDSGSYLVRVVRGPVSSFLVGDLVLPDLGGARLYRLSSGGRHLATVHALTGQVLHAFGYDAAGRLAEVRDGAGTLLAAIERRAGGATVVAAGGQRTELGFGPGGLLETVVDPAGGAWALSYTPDGLLTRLADPAGGVARFAYDGTGALTRHEDPAGGVTTLARAGTPMDEQVTVSPFGGVATTYQTHHTEAGGVERTVSPAGCPISSWRTDSSGGTRVEHADGTTVEEVLGADARFGWLAPTLVSRTVTTPAGLRSVATFSEQVTLATPGDPLSLTASHRSVVVNGRAWRLDWEAASGALTATTPQGRVVRRTLDPSGRVTSLQVGALAPLVLSYEAPARLTEQRRSAGPETRRTAGLYGADGTLARVTDATGRAATLEHDAAARPVAVTGPGGDTLRVTRDGLGAAVAVDTPLGARHRLVREGRGLLAAHEPPAVGGDPPGADRVAFGYDTERRLVRLDLPGGAAVAQGRGCGGRLEWRTTPEGTTTFDHHPATGTLSRITDPRGVVLDLTFDGPLLLQQRWSGPVTGAVASAWDRDFALALETVNGQAVDYGRDGDGFPVRAGPLALTWDPSGLLAGTTAGLLETRAGHDAFGDLAWLEASAAASGLLSASYQRDPLGRVVQIDEVVEGLARSWALGYDAAGRLEAATLSEGAAPVASWSYLYDPAGNRVGASGPGGPATATFDAQDRLLAQGGEAFGWSRSGHLVQRSGAAGTTRYTVDALGSLVAVDLPDGRRVEYLVDGAGRRVGKRVDGVPVQGLLYRDGRRVAAELDGAGEVVGRFVYASRADVPDLLLRGGSTYRLVTDHLGSVRLVVDVATGATAQRLDYDPFGQVLVDTNPGFQPFGFAGGLRDLDTGLVRLGVRDYDPATGRFTSRDPLLFGGGGNLYAYAGGDPVNRADPTGLCGGPCPDDRKPDPDDLLRRLRDLLARAEKGKSALGHPDGRDPLGALRQLKGLLDTLNDLNGELGLLDFGNVPVDFILQEMDAALDALERGLDTIEAYQEKVQSIDCSGNLDGTTSCRAN